MLRRADPVPVSRWKGTEASGCTLAQMAEDRFIVADALVAGGVDLDTLRLVLPRVDPRTVTASVAPMWFRAVWGKRIAAVCMAWGIYVQPAVMQRYRRGDDPPRIARLMVHELTHLEQWRRLGAFGHSVQYLGDYLRARLSGVGHWESYRGVRLEVEARQTARLVASMPSRR